MTSPWYSLKLIHPRTRQNLLDWAEDRKVRVVGWKDRELYLIDLRAHKEVDLVRGTDQEGFNVIEEWDNQWEVVGEESTNQSETPCAEG